MMPLTEGTLRSTLRVAPASTSRCTAKSSLANCSPINSAIGRPRIDAAVRPNQRSMVAL